MSEYLRLRQICLVAHELEPLEAHLATILGINVCHRDPKLSRFGLVNVLFPIGTSFLEIVAPVQESTAAGRFIERSKGCGGYMAIFDCDDPAVRRQHTENLGIRTVNINRQEDYFGVQMHPRDCRAAMIEFGHTANGENLTGPYWPAGDHWQDASFNEQAQALTGIELASQEPESLAERWANILDLPVEREGADPSIVVAGRSIRCVHASASRERLSALHIEVADVARAKTAAAALGYRVESDSFHLGGVDFRLKVV